MSVIVGMQSFATCQEVFSQFGVFGYFHQQYKVDGVATAGGWRDGQNDNHPNLFYNQPVTVKKEGSEYSCWYPEEDSRFWPRNTLDRISFLAYYPYNDVIYNGSELDGDSIVEPVLDAGDDGMVGFYYIVPYEDTKQVDFMVSDLCMDQSKSAGRLTGTDKVKFNFHHALSQVRIKAVNFDTSGNNGVELKINYILFEGVAVFGMCVPTPDYGTLTEDGNVTVRPEWPTTNLSPTRPDVTENVLAHQYYDAVTGDPVPENILLMIPHEFLSGSRITVNFDVTRPLDDEDSDRSTNENYIYKDCTLSAPLANYQLGEWEPGFIYNYIINLDLKKITFTCDVSPWLAGGDDVILEEVEDD